MYRLPKPLNCPDALWGIISSCWEISPNSRPTFAELLVRLKDFYEMAFSEPPSAYNSFDENENLSSFTHESDANLKKEKKKGKHMKKRDSKKKSIYDRSPYSLDPADSQKDTTKAPGYIDLKLANRDPITSASSETAKGDEKAKEGKLSSESPYDNQIQVKNVSESNTKKPIDDTKQVDIKKPYLDIPKKAKEASASSGSSPGASESEASESEEASGSEGSASVSGASDSSASEDQPKRNNNHYDQDVQVTSKPMKDLGYLENVNKK